MGESKPHRFHLDLLSGKAYGAMAEFWFKYVGYCLIVAGVMAVSDIGGSLLILAIKWLSIFSLYAWLRRQVEIAFIYFWPELEPEWGCSPNMKRLLFANTLALPLVVLGYSVGLKAAEIIIQLKA
jgi:hypothetical protein